MKRDRVASQPQRKQLSPAWLYKACLCNIQMTTRGQLFRVPARYKRITSAADKGTSREEIRPSALPQRFMRYAANYTQSERDPSVPLICSSSVPRVLILHVFSPRVSKLCSFEKTMAKIQDAEVCRRHEDPCNKKVCVASHRVSTLNYNLTSSFHEVSETHELVLLSRERRRIEKAPILSAAAESYRTCSLNIKIRKIGFRKN